MTELTSVTSSGVKLAASAAAEAAAAASGSSASLSPAASDSDSDSAAALRPAGAFLLPAVFWRLLVGTAGAGLRAAGAFAVCVQSFCAATRAATAATDIASDAAADLPSGQGEACRVPGLGLPGLAMLAVLAFSMLVWSCWASASRIVMCWPHAAVCAAAFCPFFNYTMPEWAVIGGRQFETRKP